MAHFAKINDENIVEQVIVLSNESCGEPALSFPDTCAAGQQFIADVLKLDGVWRQCSYSNSFRRRYAGCGYIYFAENDVFIAPQPFPSWTLDENFDWQPPTPMPLIDKLYRWSEEDLEWVAV